MKKASKKFCKKSLMETATRRAWPVRNQPDEAHDFGLAKAAACTGTAAADKAENQRGSRYLPTAQQYATMLIDW